VSGLGYFVRAILGFTERKTGSCVKFLILVMLELFYLPVTLMIMRRRFASGMLCASGISLRELELIMDSERLDFLWRCRATTISMNNFVTHRCAILEDVHLRPVRLLTTENFSE
jgi:hypothetical protein